VPAQPTGGAAPPSSSWGSEAAARAKRARRARVGRNCCACACPGPWAGAGRGVVRSAQPRRDRLTHRQTHIRWAFRALGGALVKGRRSQSHAEHNACALKSKRGATVPTISHPADSLPARQLTPLARKFAALRHARNGSPREGDRNAFIACTQLEQRLAASRCRSCEQHGRRAGRREARRGGGSSEEARARQPTPSPRRCRRCSWARTCSWPSRSR
jgi:hypothetical protein